MNTKLIYLSLQCHFTSADKSDDDKISYDEFMEAMGCQNKNVHSLVHTCFINYSWYVYGSSILYVNTYIGYKCFCISYDYKG